MTIKTEEVAVDGPPQYTFSWGGVRFNARSQSSLFEGMRTAVPAGPGWSAAVSVDGWLWRARLTVNGGTAGGEGPTPWQALDAALAAWTDIVAALARSFGEKPADPPV